MFWHLEGSQIKSVKHTNLDNQPSSAVQILGQAQDQRN